MALWFNITWRKHCEFRGPWIHLDFINHSLASLHDKLLVISTTTVSRGSYVPLLTADLTYFCLKLHFFFQDISAQYISTATPTHWGQIKYCFMVSTELSHQINSTAVSLCRHRVLATMDYSQHKFFFNSFHSLTSQLTKKKKEKFFFMWCVDATSCKWRFQSPLHLLWVEIELQTDTSQTPEEKIQIPENGPK